MSEHAKTINGWIPYALQAGATGAWSWDVERDEVLFCPVTAGLFGLPPSEEPVPIDRFLAAVHPDDRFGLASSIETSIRVGGLFDAEYRTIAAGCPHRVNARGVFARDHEGVVSAYGVVIDISESSDGLDGHGPVEPIFQVENVLDRVAEHCIAGFELARHLPQEKAEQVKSRLRAVLLEIGHQLAAELRAVPKQPPDPSLH